MSDKSSRSPHEEELYKHGDAKTVLWKMVRLKSLFCFETVIHTEGEPDKTISVWTSGLAEKLYKELEVIHTSIQRKEGEQYGS